MSFILEALKKLEQNRLQGTVPDLMTIHEVKSQSPNRIIWPYVVIAILTVNAGILTAVFRPWEAEEQRSVTRVSVEKHRESVPEPAKQQDVRINESQSTDSHIKESSVVSDKKPITKKLPKNSEPIIAKTEITPRSQKRENPPLLPEENIMELQQTQEDTVNYDQNPIEDTSVTRRMNTSSQEMELIRKKIKDETSHFSTAPLLKNKPVANVRDNSNKQVLEFGQLPEETKKELPNLTISGHIYSNNPHSRIVTINGSTIREGEEATKGLTVREITISGVIFDYQGLHFQIRAF